MRHKVYVNSFPKGGTHLLNRLLELLGYRNSGVFISAGRTIGSGENFYRSLIFWRDLIINETYRTWFTTNRAVIIGVDTPVGTSEDWVKRRLGRVHPGEIAAGHVRYSEYYDYLLAKAGMKVFQVIRDPRDIVVSHAHYVSTLKQHFLYTYYQSLPDWNSRLAFSITGGYVKGGLFLESIGARIKGLDGWMLKPEVLTIKFEDLVGPEGGGDSKTQIETLEKIKEFLGMEISESETRTARDQLFGDSATFRKGQIGGWKEEFSEEHYRLFEEYAGDHLLKKWGYQ